MELKRLAAAAVTLALGGTLLSSCSYAASYAATLNTAGHVQIESCEASNHFYVEDATAADLIEVGGPYDTKGGIDAIDLQAPATGVTISGTIDFAPDNVLRIWDSRRLYDEAHTTTIATTTTRPAAGATTVALYVATPPTPELTFTVGDLREGKYLHDGDMLSKDDWHDVCDHDDGPLLGPVGLLAGLICVGVVLCLVVYGIASATGQPRYPPRHAPGPAGLPDPPR